MSMKKLTIVWGLIMLGLFTSLTVFAFTYTNKRNDYKKLEESLSEAAKKYGEEKFLYNDVTDAIKVDFHELKNAGFIDNLNIKNDTCSGYAKISKNDYVFKYNGFIKCKNYTTKGY